MSWRAALTWAAWYVGAILVLLGIVLFVIAMLLAYGVIGPLAVMA